MKKRDITNILLLLLFKIIIEYIYVNVLHPHYGYLGLSLSFNIVKSIESYFLLITIYYFIDKRKDKPSAIFMQILFVLSIIPILSIYGLKNESRLALYISLLSFVLTLLIARFLPKIKLVKLKNAKVLYFLVIGGLTLLTYVLLIKDNGIPGLLAFNFNQTYSYRSNVVYNSLTGYLVPWQARVVNIFLIAVFYLRKEYKKILIPFFLQIILFLITSHKAYLFSPVAVIGVDVEIGKGTAVMAGVVLNCSTRIGKGCIINTSSSIDNDNIIEDYAHISPGAGLTGMVKVGKGSWLGIGSVVSNNVNIYSGFKVGAGAVVVKDITEPGTYVGVPVRKID